MNLHSLIRNHVDKYVITKHYQLMPLSLATVNLSPKRQGSYGLRLRLCLRQNSENFEFSKI
ncbi:hypothetical protein T06_15785 [Trichinella sp. T6]|nr:hypothetical protein T06_15785 [Trichinella sp. T6]